MTETFGFDEALRRMKGGAHVGRTKPELAGHHYFKVRPVGVLEDGSAWRPCLVTGWLEKGGFWGSWVPSHEELFAVDWYEL